MVDVKGRRPWSVGGLRLETRGVQPGSAVCNPGPRSGPVGAQMRRIWNSAGQAPLRLGWAAGCHGALAQARVVLAPLWGWKAQNVVTYNAPHKAHFYSLFMEQGLDAPF